MRYTVVYSSKTGNTKKVAEAILEVMPQGTDIYSVENAPEPDQYDCLALGFWVDRGMPTQNMKEYMKRVENKKVGIFITLGAYPDSKHAGDCIQNGKSLVMSDNDIMATFICQGKLDPEITKKFDTFPPDHPHAMTPERRERHETAKSHPDEKDLAMAKDVFQKMINEIKGV